MAKDKKREPDLEVVDDELEDDEEEEFAEIVEEARASGAVGFLTGLVVGAFVGVGMALLLAPERGDVTRRRIRTKIRDVTDDARDQFDDWRDGAERELRRRQRKLRKRLQRDN
jgi:hypothetical protein